MVHIAPISPQESSRLHLVAVTADGRRVYFSACEPPLYGSSAPPRPSYLRAQVARQAPPLPSSSSEGRRDSAQPSRCAVSASQGKPADGLRLTHLSLPLACTGGAAGANSAFELSWGTT